MLPLQQSSQSQCYCALPLCPAGRRNPRAASSAAALFACLQEDEQLRELVAVHGVKAWAKIASLIRTKGSKQCRRRWKNFLNMSAKTCSWSAEVGQTF
jgi:hypothetical protein